MRFWKGHGTENDFVLLLDPDGALDLTDDLVGRLCDRRAGLGADGVLRVVRSAAADEAVPEGAEWFMDHRNADGSRPEMCGNGVRLFAHFLLHQGLVAPGTLSVATRGGVKTVEAADGLVTVDMGPAVVGEPVLVDGTAATFVDMGNPHAVLPVPSVAALGELHTDRLDLNVEWVERIGPSHLSFRVHERGVGETRSCGTGACAVVVADSLAGGAPRGTPVDVDVLGGRLVVTWLDDGHVLLQGPAVLVAEGELEKAWLVGG
jgi:diaminopimelate epimerase